MRPMKAPTQSITDEQLFDLVYPVIGSPKVDGFRGFKMDKVYTASMKELPNLFTQFALSHVPHGYDGELAVGSPFSEFEGDDVFARTSGALRRRDGSPDVRFYVFDNFLLDLPYKDRLSSLKDIERVTVLQFSTLYSPQEVIDYEAMCVEDGYEGAMIRSIEGRYKQGRCTLREQNIFKRKPFEDDEAVIVGFVEKMHNGNEQIVTELGLSKRSSHGENLIPANTLGAFILQSKKWNKTFTCGAAMKAEQAKEIWEHKENYLGKTVTYKFQRVGSKDAPRLPIFKGFRDKFDMTRY